jgi:hypothetical protein
LILQSTSFLHWWGLIRRGFDCRAILILQSTSFLCWWGLIQRGRLSERYEFGTNSLGLPTPCQRRRASWAPLGRLMACRATRDGNSLGRYTGCSQGREPEPGGLAGLPSRFRPMANRKMRKGFLFFKSVLNYKLI